MKVTEVLNQPGVFQVHTYGENDDEDVEDLEVYNHVDSFPSLDAAQLNVKETIRDLKKSTRYQGLDFKVDAMPNGKAWEYHEYDSDDPAEYSYTYYIRIIAPRSVEVSQPTAQPQ